ncbi:helix-turn-helix domain-containing protein [Brevibacillus porteri]|uniref:helix-turn-helix domain-containing protein n=1 Tax=Brevibacillus porteri TaxID=2126350 RepID=UPI003D240717
MAFSYKPLWKLMIEREIKKGELREFLSGATVAKMGKDEFVAMDVLDKICTHLNCRIEDIVEHVPDNK